MRPLLTLKVPSGSGTTADWWHSRKGRRLNQLARPSAVVQGEKCSYCRIASYLHGGMTNEIKVVVSIEGSRELHILLAVGHERNISCFHPFLYKEKEQGSSQCGSKTCLAAIRCRLD